MATVKKQNGIGYSDIHTAVKQYAKDQEFIAFSLETFGETTTVNCGYMLENPHITKNSSIAGKHQLDSRIG